MRVAIGSDHGGLKTKIEILKYLDRNNIEYLDMGTYDTVSVDYPDIAVKVCKKVLEKEVDYGILTCTTGTGMCITANKIKGIRCAKVFNEDEARLAREHNNCNCIAISSYFKIEDAYKLLDAFLNTDFSEEERHQRRVNKMSQIEELDEY